jgi:hypothetical protein
LAKTEPNEETDDKDASGISDFLFCLLHQWIIRLEIFLKVVDINDEDERRRYEGEQLRIRSASNQKIVESTIKPTSLYVSNWTDDEKCRRSKEPMRLNDTQLADR